MEKKGHVLAHGFANGHGHHAPADWGPDGLGPRHEPAARGRAMRASALQLGPGAVPLNQATINGETTPTHCACNASAGARRPVVEMPAVRTRWPGWPAQTKPIGNPVGTQFPNHRHQPTSLGFAQRAALHAAEGFSRRRAQIGACKLRTHHHNSTSNVF